MSYVNFEKQPQVVGKNKLKIFFTNVLTGNNNVAALLESIKKKQPDIIGLVEINSYWVRELKPLRKDYPFFQEIPKEHNFGLAIYSKRKLDHSFSIDFHPTSEPSIIAKVTLNNEIFNIIVTHTLPPVGNQYFNIRNSHLKEMAKYTQMLKGHVVVMGDFNLTQWSPFYRDYVRVSGLKNLRDGRGIYSTWFFGPLAIPIDHFFVSKSLNSASFEVLDDFGSDHRPIFTTINY
ncbi:MAG: hypothetical protein COA79_07165 [Planctomycetota bacterium]|nr:MAG: hypothetical protein COA79_07165 [Planctomycetota bacterium]